MNYMPCTTLFLLTSNKKENFNDIKDFLKEELSYLGELKLEIDDNSMYVNYYGEISAMSFFETNERLGEIYKHLDIEENNIQFLEVSSGPNHNLDYMPMYYATEVALLNYEGACIAGRDEKLLKMKDCLEWFDEYISDLEEILEDDDSFGIVQDSAELVIKYIKIQISKYKL